MKTLIKKLLREAFEIDEIDYQSFKDLKVLQDALSSGLIISVAYVKKDGTIQNSSYSTLGYVKDDGTVQNSSYSTLGYAKNVKKEWAAVVFFFFKFN